jgi:hypothetical protein
LKFEDAMRCLAFAFDGPKIPTQNLTKLLIPNCETVSVVYYKLW